MEKLREFGLEDIQTGLAGHGVSRDTARAEKTARCWPYAPIWMPCRYRKRAVCPISRASSGVMHACGHDGHTATLLGAAQVLSKMRDELPGPVKFIFQPAEETTGGADAMMAAGVLNGVEAIVALHGWPSLEIGQIGYRPGPMMASADIFDLTIKGKGGHAAYPHTTVDPIVIGSQIVAAFQTLASREISPVDSVVVSVTQFHAGTAYNVIPGIAELKGTVRCLSNAVRDEMPARLERIIAGICAAFRAEYEFCLLILARQSWLTIPRVTALIEAVGTDLLGAGRRDVFGNADHGRGRFRLLPARNPRRDVPPRRRHGSDRPAHSHLQFFRRRTAAWDRHAFPSSAAFR